MREELADKSSEEKPPEIEGAIEAVKLEWLDMEAGLFEKFCGASDSRERFGRGWADGSGVEDADARGVSKFARSFLEGCRDRECVVSVGASENVEEYTDVSGRASHGADDADPAVRIIAGRKVAGAGDAARSGFESTDAAEMSGDANRAATIASDAAEGKPSGNSRGFSAAGAAG